MELLACGYKNSKILSPKLIFNPRIKTPILPVAIGFITKDRNSLIEVFNAIHTYHELTHFPSLAPNQHLIRAVGTGVVGEVAPTP